MSRENKQPRGISENGLYREGMVLLIQGSGRDEHGEEQMVLITRIGGDGTIQSDSVDFTYVMEDGSTQGSGHFPGSRTRNVKLVDFAKVDTLVTVPAEYKTRTKEMTKGMEGEEYEKHPSYGLVSITRTTGGGRSALFMSPFRHQQAMTLNISRAKIDRSLHHDHVFEEENLISIDLSEAQFARMVSSTGNGVGTPCTLTSVGGDLMPRPPERKDLEKFQDDVKKDMLKAGEALLDAEAKIKALLDKPNVTKTDRREIEHLLNEATRRFRDHLPYTVEQLGEHMNKVVESAKIEVDAYVNLRIETLGREALAAGAPISMALDSGSERSEGLVDGTTSPLQTPPKLKK